MPYIHNVPTNYYSVLYLSGLSDNPAEQLKSLFLFDLNNNNYLNNLFARFMHIVF